MQEWVFFDCGCALALVLDEGSKLSYPSTIPLWDHFLAGDRPTDRREGCNGPFTRL